jgi:Ca2+-binding RTX toxin-like protein
MVNKAGGSGYDVLDGTSEGDLLHGYGYNDVLYGYDGDDLLYGDSLSDPVGGSDTLYGGAGDDYIDGASDSIMANYYGAHGIGDWDTLTGGAGHDTFVLGDEYGSYYLNKDYKVGAALITDFDIGRDTIQLAGSQEYYTFSTTTGNPNTGTAISLKPEYSLTGRSESDCLCAGCP